MSNRAIIGIILVVVAVIALAVGLVNLSKTPTEVKSQNESEEKERLKKEKPSPEFLQQKEKLKTADEKLQAASQAIQEGGEDFTPVYEAAKEIIEPASFLRNYIEAHPDVEAGAETLIWVAAIYNLVDALIGGEKQYIAETYYLLIDLYPNFKDVSEAKRWLRVNGYDVD